MASLLQTQGIAIFKERLFIKRLELWRSASSHEWWWNSHWIHWPPRPVVCTYQVSCPGVNHCYLSSDPRFSIDSTRIDLLIDVWNVLILLSPLRILADNVFLAWCSVRVYVSRSHHIWDFTASLHYVCKENIESKANIHDAYSSHRLG
jgi:hypothetical protein